MNVKNWSFFSSKEKKCEIKQNILDTVSLWGAIGLLWNAFVFIIGEHFPEFIMVHVLASKSEMVATSVVTSTNFVAIGMDWWVIGLFVFLLWLGYEWPKYYLKKWIVPCRLAAIAVPIAYIIVKFNKILDGIYQLAEIYLPFVNSYYNTRFYLQPTNTGSSSVVAFTASCMLLWWLTWKIAYITKKRVLLGLFPLFALLLELLVGLSPQGNGMLHMFFAVILIGVMGGTSVLKKVVVLVGIMLSVLGSSIFFEAEIKALATKETKQELLRWQNNLDLEKYNLLRLLQIDLHFNWEPLNNDSPRYTGKVVLEVESGNELDSVVYLRGFYGTNYENGNWTYDVSHFETTCKENGVKPEEIAEFIFQMPYDKMQAHYGANEQDYSYKGSPRDKRNMFRILYTGTTGDVAYVPYLSDYTSLDDAYTLLGDYLLKKDIWDNTIEVQGLKESAEASHWGEVNAKLESRLISGCPDWINDLSTAYLQLPEENDFIVKAASKVKEYIQENDLYDMYFGSTEYEGDNASRMLYADAVGSYLAGQMSYSLRLDNLPLGRDPIEYALTDSHEGYCMHFASAATLILRELGVPARYVSGYAVEPSAFEYERGRGAYIAEVGDYMAHAWVEIYLDDIGWVPVEVTPGSSLDNLPTDGEIQRWESLSNSRRQDIIDAENETETNEKEQPLDETETEEEEEIVSEESQTSDQTTELEQEEGEKVDDTDKQMDWIDRFFEPLSFLVLFAVIGVGLYILAKGWRIRYERILREEISQKLTRKAIKRINRRLYRRLRLSNVGSWFGKKWSDCEFSNALIENFATVSKEEWERYMEIVKKNHFSYETISEEEMMYCYECYKKAFGFNKKLTI